MSKHLTTTRTHGRAARREATARLMECFDWPGDHKSETLAALADDLARQKVELSAFWVYDSPRHGGKLAAIPKEPAKLRALLEKRRIQPQTSWCFYVRGKGVDDAFQALAALNEAGIPVECADVLNADDGGVGVLWVPEADVPRARDVLEGRRAGGKARGS